jgi:hypothetical protein
MFSLTVMQYSEEEEKLTGLVTPTLTLTLTLTLNRYLNLNPNQVSRCVYGRCNDIDIYYETPNDVPPGLLNWTVTLMEYSPAPLHLNTYPYTLTLIPTPHPLQLSNKEMVHVASDSRHICPGGLHCVKVCGRLYKKVHGIASGTR